MTCYFRHLSKTFERAGIEITAENRRAVDRIIHNIVGVNYKNCSETWKRVKDRISEDESGFTSILKEKWSNLH
jgi:hypothetical protein